MRTIMVACAAMVLVSACAPIERTSTFEQPIGQQLVAGPGELVAKVTKQRSLQNVVGAADIFGRQTDEGYAELRFAGVEASGELVFYRRDVNILTNETTMSRQNVSHAFVSGSRTNASATIVGPPQDYHLVVPAEAMPIRLPAGTPSFAFEGRMIEILGASPTALSYRVR